jgi:hypothetical protein
MGIIYKIKGLPVQYNERATAPAPQTKTQQNN